MRLGAQPGLVGCEPTMLRSGWHLPAALCGRMASTGNEQPEPAPPAERPVGVVSCPTCGADRRVMVPAEPPVGAWVKDKHGAAHYRTTAGWAAAPTGFYPGGKWSAMWEARGPLVECGPYGADPQSTDVESPAGRKAGSGA